MNWIIVPVRNNLHLTKKAVASFRKQDIGDVAILLIDNASTDGTAEWLNTQNGITRATFDPPASVAKSWNFGLKTAFDYGADWALVVNNDVELRPDTYRRLVEDGGGFVTAVGTRDKEKIKPHEDYVFGTIKGGTYQAGDAVMVDDLTKVEPWFMQPDPDKRRPHPDFSCFLIRRWVYEKVGPFDEKFEIAFCEDGDYDLRMYRAGIRAYCLDLPFLHHGSMTIKNADDAEIRKIQRQADVNRRYFEKKWGFPMASEAYYRALDKGGPEPEKSAPE